MAGAGAWYASGGYWQVIVDGTTSHRYRITSTTSGKNGVPAAIKIDGKKTASDLKPGESRDIEGKKIEMGTTTNQANAFSQGTYDNLD